MVLSEAEAEAQLSALRRQRESLDRAIADLTLYLELGRRLTAGGGPGRGVTHPDAVPVPGVVAPAAETAGPTVPVPPVAPRHAGPHPGVGPTAPGHDDPATAHASATLRHDPGEAILSEGVLARRYGRALIEAALSALDEAGRPLHAGEILAKLSARGFTLPGHDPVAALNTRLWKRSGAGGPLKRMGEAVYALAEEEN